MVFNRLAMAVFRSGPEPGGGSAGQRGCSGEVSVLYPPPSAVLSIGSGRFPQGYFAVESCIPRICRYSEQNVSYEKMTPFSNTGDGLYQTNRIYPGIGKSYTYYVSCRAADGSTTAPVKVAFSLDKNQSPVSSSLRPVARSATTVQVDWGAPDKEPKEYKVFRDGAFVGISKQGGYLDRNLKPDTLYRYSVVAVYPNGDQPPTLPAPVHTLKLSGDTTPAAPVMLDDFEAPVRVVNPNLDKPWQRNLWSIYPSGDLSRRSASMGTLSISPEDVHGGRSSLKALVSGEIPPPTTAPGGLYLLFYPYTERDNHWHFLHEYVRAGEWKPGIYNRLRFWVKVPKSFEGMRKPVGQFNMDFGSYIRSSNGNPVGSGGSESGLGGGHYYHRFNIPYSGEWHQVIVDEHPTHQRGGSGYSEWGDMPNPTGEQGFTYFDLLTTFYLDFESHLPLASYPSAFYFDDFELYKETNPENTEQISSLNGVYIPAKNEIFVGWNHPKDDDKTKHEVRYSFDDIHKIGWDRALPAPDGIVKPVGTAYNGMEYSTTKIAVAGHDHVTIAIKPQGSTLFRQIVIPVKSKR